MQRMAAHLSDAGTPAYVLNLDPAVMTVPYGANIDIRDTVCLCTSTATMACTSWCSEQDVPMHCEMLTCNAGELQKRDEAVLIGTKRGHPDVFEPLCHAL